MDLSDLDGTYEVSNSDMNDPLKVLRSNNILNSKQTFRPKWWKYAYLTPRFITNGVPYGCSGPRFKREAAHTRTHGNHWV